MSRRCLLYAGWYPGQHGLEGDQHTNHHPILGQVSQPVSPVRSHDVFTQVSRVTIGHRAGRSSAIGFADAELLSASFRPNGLPSRYACCVVLTPLSKRNFSEVISCAVKGRTPLRTVHEGFPSHRSSLSKADLSTQLPPSQYAFAVVVPAARWGAS